MNRAENTRSTRPASLGPDPSRQGRRARRNPATEKAAAAFTGLPKGHSHSEIAELLRVAGPRLGWNATLTHHFWFLLDKTQPQDWLPHARPIVWLEVHDIAFDLGLSQTSVRRNERQMHEFGAITWIDSPNHNRFGERDEDGNIVHAFGVDLSPSAAMLPHLHEIAAQCLRPENLAELLARVRR